MSVFTTVTTEQLSDWLRNYELGTLVSLQGIPSGIENTNYFVTTTNGKYVLTLFERLTAPTILYCLNLMTHLSHHDIPCPKPIANLNNQFLGKLNNKPASLVTCLSGKSLEFSNSENCKEVGILLAKIHISGLSYPDQMKNSRGHKWRKITALKVMPFLPKIEAKMLEKELCSQLSYCFNDLPRGVIHADLFRDNILFVDNVIGGVIDFYFACNDTLLYDLAITVNDWCMSERGELDTENMLSLLRAYHHIRPLTARERDAWPTILRVGALRFWVSRLYDYYLPRVGELTYTKDPAYFRRILENLSTSHAKLVGICI